MGRVAAQHISICIVIYKHDTRSDRAQEVFYKKGRKCCTAAPNPPVHPPEERMIARESLPEVNAAICSAGTRSGTLIGDVEHT